MPTFLKRPWALPMVYCPWFHGACQKLFIKGTKTLPKICTTTNANRNTHANTDSIHESLPVDDEYKKPAIDSLRKCVPHILGLQYKYVYYPSLL